ncbi:MAG: CatB-related O-acetyltransferase [Solirubrobacteraceae bacterium]
MPYLVYHSPPTFLSEQKLDRRIDAGAFTYFDKQITFAVWREDDAVSVGRYCSIARDCIIFAGGNHYVQRATTYPFHAFGAGGDRAFDVREWEAPNAPTRIGHDVWLGHGARVMPGATIGEGCVVGAGAVVAGHLAPYTIAAGNPAVTIRKRFSDSTIDRLLTVAWWDWPPALVLANLALLLSAPETWPDPLVLADDEPFRGVVLPIALPARARASRRLRAIRKRLSRIPGANLRR